MNAILGCLLTTFLFACSGQGSFPTTRAEKGEQLNLAQSALQSAATSENHVALGLAQASLGQHPAAIASYRRALELDSASFAAHNHLCLELNFLGKWMEAMTHCEQAVRSRPDSESAENGLRFARKQQSLYGITNGAELINSGMEFYSKGNWAEAVRIWLLISPESPLYAAGRSNLASAYILMKDFDRAREAINEALLRDPKNDLYLNNLRWLENAVAGNR